jgi:hypothetical protein
VSAAKKDPISEARVRVARDLENEHRRDRAAGLRTLLTGNLYLDDTGSGCSPERALQRVATAQLRAIRAAMTTWDCEVMSAPQATEGERPGWEPGDTFTKNDAIEALGGVVALLHNGPDLLDEASSDLEACTTEREAAE